MIAGPVCHFELMRIARRRRFYAMRLAFGLVVLAILGVNYLGHFGAAGLGLGPGARGRSIRDLAGFGHSVLWSLMAAQGGLVLVLTPALVADAIASERQRKTLPYLLVSCLPGGAIVLGKLAARLANVGAFAALTLPVASLLTLIGGVEPEGLIWGYATLGAMAYFVAALAILASVLARRPRDAVGAAYTLTAAWLFAPALLDILVASATGPASSVPAGLKVIADWAWPASPPALLIDAPALLAGGHDVLRRRVAWVVASLMAYGTLFVALAAWRLRPAFRRHEGAAGRAPRSIGRSRRLRRQPPCGDDPVFWKEAHFARPGGGLARHITGLIVLTLWGVAVVAVLLSSHDAFLELWANGYGYGNEDHYRRRLAFNIVLRFAATGLFALWMIHLASITAAGLTSEREQDTWTSLIATPLDGAAILRGKMFGALYATRFLGASIVGLWLVGLAAGSVHPLGLLLALAVLALTVWFVVALGTFITLKSRTTWRAQAWVLAILLAPNLGCLGPVPSIFAILGYSLLSYAEIHEATSGALPIDPETWFVIGLVGVFLIGGLVAYGVAAYLLTRGAFRGFDTAADRPRRMYLAYRLGRPTV